MFFLAGSIVVLVCVLGGFIMEGGQILRRCGIRAKS